MCVEQRASDGISVNDNSDLSDIRIFKCRLSLFLLLGGSSVVAHNLRQPFRMIRNYYLLVYSVTSWQWVNDDRTQFLLECYEQNGHLCVARSEVTEKQKSSKWQQQMNRRRKIAFEWTKDGYKIEKLKNTINILALFEQWTQTWCRQQDHHRHPSTMPAYPLCAQSVHSCCSDAQKPMKIIINSHRSRILLCAFRCTKSDKKKWKELRKSRTIPFRWLQNVSGHHDERVHFVHLRFKCADRTHWVKRCEMKQWRTHSRESNNK